MTRIDVARRLVDVIEDDYLLRAARRLIRICMEAEWDETNASAIRRVASAAAVALPRSRNRNRRTATRS
jgi:hypothetical protein